MTQKLHPKDLDFVTFIEGGVFESKQKELDRFWSFSNEEKGLDAYLLAEFEAGHPDFLEFVRFKSVWVKRFSTGNKNDNLHTIQKGFFQIIFQK